MAKRKKPSIVNTKAATAGIELFYSKKPAFLRKRKNNKFLRRLRVTTREEAAEFIFGGKHAITLRDPFLRKKVIGLENTFRKKERILHELAHFFKLGKNHHLTANSIDGYFGRMQKWFKPSGSYKPWLKDAEEIANGPQPI